MGADGLLVFATFLLVMVTLYYAIHTGHMVKQMRLAREAEIRPIVEVGSCIVDIDGKGLLAVCKNVGPGPALDVRITVKPVSPSDAKEWPRPGCDFGTDDDRFEAGRVHSIASGGGIGVELESIQPSEVDARDDLIEIVSKDRKKLLRWARHYLAATRHPGVAARLPLTGPKTDAWALTEDGFLHDLVFDVRYTNAFSEEHRAIMDTRGSFRHVLGGPAKGSRCRRLPGVEALRRARSRAGD